MLKISESQIYFYSFQTKIQVVDYTQQFIHRKRLKTYMWRPPPMIQLPSGTAFILLDVYVINSVLLWAHCLLTNGTVSWLLINLIYNKFTDL